MAGWARVGYSGHMKTASITEAKTRLVALLEAVRAGETVVITDRGVPVARIVPAAAEPGDDEARIARLEEKGVLRRGLLPPLPLESLPEPISIPGAVAALLEERREGP